MNLTTGQLIKVFLIAYNSICLLIIFILLLVSDKRRKNVTIRNFNYTISLMVVALFLPYGISFYAQFIEPNWLKVERLIIRDTSFPKGIEKLRIVQISDPHIKHNGIREKMMVIIINSLKPDVILITGDFLTEKNFLPILSEVFFKLKAPKGIFGIWGDNDLASVSDILELKIALENSGVKILDNEHARIPVADNKSVWIIGLTDQKPSNDAIKKAFSGVNMNDPKILLNHYPEIVDSGLISPNQANLVLSGGTHGGQVGIEFIRDIFIPHKEVKYLAGLYNVNGLKLYVNRGIGSVGDSNKSDTLRFFCRPEITLITLSGQK